MSARQMNPAFGFRSRVLLLALIAGVALPRELSGQGPPHLTLRLDIEIAAGRLGVESCLTNLPVHHRPQFILHRGLNVGIVRTAEGRLLRHTGYTNGRFIGEGVVYTVLDSVAPDDALCVLYVGAFPVYNVTRGTFSVFADWKGAIAFNGRTVRATEQSKWYPILYDSTRGTRAYEAVTYEATVRCPDCRVTYLNGDAPRPGREATFRSARAVPLMLFAGDFAIIDSFANLTILNGTPYGVSRRGAGLLAAVVDSIRSYYAEWLDIPYGERIVFLQHLVTEDNQRRHWGFVTFPTIALSNRGFSAFVVDSASFVSPLLWPYLAHEMGHYYFGTLVPGRGPYFWFVVESLAEYLSLRVVQRFHGDSVLRSHIAPYVRHALVDSTSVPFDRITSADQLHSRYHGEFAPLMLLALEELAGPEAMRRLLRAIVEQPDREWDYAALREAALANGTSPQTWRTFEETCVRPVFARGCLSRFGEGR